jgi:hypothetical protein
MRIIPFLLILLIRTGILSSQPFFNVKDYGASGTKAEKATEAIQKAIDACAAEGGGTVLFPSGEYLSGTIRLKEGVELFLSAGAVLYASQKDEDYQVPYPIYKNNDPYTDVLIYAENVSNVGIRGSGMIHGQARREYQDLRGTDSFIEAETENARKAGVEMKMFYKLPPVISLVYLVNCTDVNIKDITLYESSSWTLHVQWCDRVNIDGVFIYSDLESGVNADGIDVDGCKNVMISDCRIETADDAIVLKTTLTNNRSETCENVTVTNCVLTSTSTALKLGTESFSDYRHITFNNCVIRNTNRGLGIIVRDGATVSNVIFSNITLELDRKHFNWWGNADPIWLVVLKRTPQSKVGLIKNVLFENIIAHGQGTSKLEGLQPGTIKNVQLRNVHLFMHPEDKPDKRATHAFQAYNVKDLTLDQVQVTWREDSVEEKWANAVHLKDIEGLFMSGITGSPGLQNSNHSMIYLENVQNARLSGLEADRPVQNLVKVSGQGNMNINIGNSNWLKNAKELVNREAYVDKSVIRVYQ